MQTVSPTKTIPARTANRLHRRVLFLSSYTFQTEQISSKHNKADWLSRAQLQEITEDNLPNNKNYVFEHYTNLLLNFMTQFFKSKANVDL